ncbi:hypothetical protein [Sulfitobacter pacificus]|nr:hypothetical protein [Sulfitobacter pacificus]
MEKKDIDSILRACTRGSDYYAVPPLGNRINFHSQQIRALNLIKALHARGDGAFKGGKRSTIAVVGAGLSGITVAIGLLTKGHIVHIYDIFERPLSRQAAASHRMLHPTMNFWPDGQKKMSATTSLPFFEWYQLRCDEVISELQAEWESYSKKSNERLVEFFGHEVEGVIQGAASTYRLRVKGHGNSADLYDAVFLTVGFGNEKADDNFPTPGYWDPDTLDRDADDLKMRNKVISGAGDGGLIEVLRCLYRFKKGLLAFHVAESLEGTSVEALISDAEKQLALPDLNFEGFANVQKKYQEAVELLANAAFCENGIEKTCEDARCSCKLVEALTIIRQATRSKAFVDLVDNKARHIAFSRGAPAHKLLALLAEYDGRLKFRFGKLQKRESDGRLTIISDSGGATGSVNEVLPENGGIYVRHGAQTCFGKVIQKDEPDVFGEGHAWLSEFNVVPHFTDSDFSDGESDIAPSSLKERAKRRAKMAETALVRLASDPGARVVSIEHDQERRGTVKYLYAGPQVRFGLSSGQLFGVPIEYEGPLERGAKAVPRSRQV